MKWQKLALVTVILAGIFWNTWIFGWLNHGLAGYFRMSISELNVINQPYYLFFTITEYISGALLILAAIFLLMSYRRSFIYVLICLTIFLMGLLTLYDSATPLDCNQYLNHPCLVKDIADNVSVTNENHNTESIITDYASGFLALFIFVWFFIQKKSYYLLAGSFALFLVIVVTLEILNYSSHIFADSILERLWNVAVSIDFVLAGAIYALDTSRRKVKKLSLV